MDRVIKTLPKGRQAAADLDFWLSRPVAERIAAVELLRRQIPNSEPADDAEPRLQRVCRVASRKGR